MKHNSNLEKLLTDYKKIRNIAIIAHIDHGKTTLTDSFLASSGVISESSAGEKLFMDFHEDEQKRGITINAATISFIHKSSKFKDDFLINLIDTPGHADFGGDVTKAMRAIDGVILVVDAVEGIKTQTEIVLKQGLKQNIEVVLYINKIDRLINELNLNVEEIKLKINKLITSINHLFWSIKLCDPEYKTYFSLSKGNVTIGSAKHKWGYNKFTYQEKKLKVTDIIKLELEGSKKLPQITSLSKYLLDSVVSFLPSPDTAQKNKIENIWPGDKNSNDYQYLISCKRENPMIGIITNITNDKSFGKLIYIRIFSGTLKKGTPFYIIPSNVVEKVGKVSLMMGKGRLEVKELPAGNIGVLQGIKNCEIGSTISYNPKFEPFDKIKHHVEPIVTIAIVPKSINDLTKLKNIIKDVIKSNPTLSSKYNIETGEFLISGLGVLHLEVIINRIEKENNIPIKVSKPIIIYRETIKNLKSKVFETVTSNSHNKMKVSVFKLSKKVIEILKEADNNDRFNLKNYKSRFIDAGFTPKLFKKIVSHHNKNLFINNTRGVLYLDETLELFKEGFKKGIESGPLIKKPLIGIGILLEDTILHIDHMHRGPSQIIPGFRKAILLGIKDSEPCVLEPIKKIVVDISFKDKQNVVKELLKRRTNIIQTIYEGEFIRIIGHTPVNELDDFQNTFMSLTEGRGLWSSSFLNFKEMPSTVYKKFFQNNI